MGWLRPSNATERRRHRWRRQCQGTDRRQPVKLVVRIIGHSIVVGPLAAVSHWVVEERPRRRALLVLGHVAKRVIIERITLIDR